MIFNKEANDVEVEVRNGTGNIAVEATAGAGKTTLLLKCLTAVPKTKRTVFLSFSKAIVDELVTRVPKGIPAKTLHALGAGMVYGYYKGLTLDQDKYFKIAKDMFPREKDREKAKQQFKHCYWIQDIVNFARMTLVPHEPDRIIAMCNYYNLEFLPEIIDKVVTILKGIGKKNFTTIDFTDMIYLPVIMPHLIYQKFDYVFWDEAQDANRCQMKFIDLIQANNARLISVGDSNQAIYSFAGSSIDSFKQIQARPNTKIFTLSKSFRCPKNVVFLAQGVYKGIMYQDNAIDGDVREGTIFEIAEGDMVLSRTTLPLINLYFQLIQFNIKATIIGKDIEAGLAAFAEKVKSHSFEGVKANMDKQMTEMKADLRAAGFTKPEKHEKYSNLIEKIQVISLILNKIHSSNELIGKIHEIFAPQKNAAKLMTIHRSKGLENKRVFVIESFNGKQLMPSEYAVKDWEKIQENNLLFVAYTRSKDEVMMLNI